MTKTLPCIICRCDLEPSFVSEGREPYPGTVFTARGNYGSTVFDPSWIDERYLRIHICDKCLTSAADNSLVEMATPTREAVRTTYMSWHPSDEV